jgi:hypothetical protein
MAFLSGALSGGVICRSACGDSIITEQNYFMRMSMRHRILAVIAVMFVLLPVVAFGQLKDQLQPAPFSQVLTAPQGLIGLIGLDPRRFDMQHSYSLSYISLGGHGFSQGVYLNTMSYRFSDPLQVSLQWGIMNQPFGGGVPSLYQNGFFLSGASLEYKPSRNLSIGVQYNNIPTSQMYYSPHRGYLYQPLMPSTPSADKENH